ncbi:hypothetical protein ACUN3E_37870 [Streptomyces sp. Ju416(a)]|uniref:hypothetical protein n=1 Tax=Streptomyces TaxID=1883 RepID=UPI003806ECD3
MATRDPMPNRVFRLDKETWEAYGAACDDKGISRSDDLRMYIKREVAAHKRRQRDEAAAQNTASAD